MKTRDFPCEFCDTDQPQQRKLVTLTRQRRGQWYIFEDVPAWVCPNCGHRYFDADTAQAMEDRMISPTVDARPVTALAMTLPHTPEG
ncbi:MAG: type II toxin-antitoxin system MqsA family antitoxin [Pleurocapsa minor GSE-CHR-MK-17-07R]|nr:type II toxin-antitoxin system MqsA family antitoxin [Pleurocapsa minor GSE-CHR-MK 17-07R]